MATSGLLARLAPTAEDTNYQFSWTRFLQFIEQVGDYIEALHGHGVIPGTGAVTQNGAFGLRLAAGTELLVEGYPHPPLAAAMDYGPIPASEATVYLWGTIHVTRPGALEATEEDEYELVLSHTLNSTPPFALSIPLAIAATDGSGITSLDSNPTGKFIADLATIETLVNAWKASTKFWVGQATSNLDAEMNLGGLTTGLVKNTVSGGVGTPSTAVEGTDYYKPGGVKVVDGDLAVSYLKTDGSRALTGNQSAGGNKITNLGTPTADTDAATKAYADALANGYDLKGSCRAATTTALPAHGRVGNVLTASANGALGAIDGVTLVVNDRLLVKDEGAGSHLENGIYVVTAVGDGSNPWILTRAEDANASAEVTAGLYTFISEGTANGNEGWALTTNDPITLNTTALVFTQVAGFGPGAETGANSDITSMDGLTGWLQYPLGIKDDNGNELLGFAKVASAENYLEVVNSSSPNNPILRAAGDDTDIYVFISGKGTGGVVLGTGAGVDQNIVQIDSASGILVADYGPRWHLELPSATMSLDHTDHNLFVDASGGAVTINLPAAASHAGREYAIVKGDSSANAVTIDANSTETISGATTVVLRRQFESVLFRCDGTEWKIIGSHNRPVPATKNDQVGTTYTLLPSDDGKTVTLNNAGAITVTVPSGLGADFSCLIYQKGAGQVTLSASGTTINNRQSHLKTAGQHALCSLVATAANVLVFAGDTAA